MDAESTDSGNGRRTPTELSVAQVIGWVVVIALVMAPVVFVRLVISGMAMLT